MRTRLIQYGIMPDVLNETPKHLVEVVYGEYYKIYFGNKVNPDFCSAPPKMTWPADPKKFYTLLMVDPDQPSRLTPTDREFLLWLLVNIPGQKRLLGHTCAEYRPPEPDPGTVRTIQDNVLTQNILRRSMNLAHLLQLIFSLEKNSRKKMQQPQSQLLKYRPIGKPTVCAMFVKKLYYRINIQIVDNCILIIPLLSPY
ncbi:putative odorant-binding protein A5 isoform X3 [Bemisia tabaci]